MQIALLAAVVFAGVWFVALRPKAPSSAPPGETGLRNAVTAAHGASAASDRANALHGGAPVAARPGLHAGTGAASATAASRTKTKTARFVGQAATPGARLVERALAEHTSVAVLFYNQASPDDREVRRELARADRHLGRVVIVAAPISQLSAYRAITAKGAITGSPTLAIVDDAGNMSVMTGFVDSVQIEQAIWDVLGLDHSNLGHLLHTPPLSLKEYRRRAKTAARRTRRGLVDEFGSTTAGTTPDELAPYLQAVLRLESNDISAFASLTPPRRLLGAHRAVVSIYYRYLATAQALQARVARSAAPLLTFLRLSPGFRTKARALDAQLLARGRPLGLGRSLTRILH